MEDTGYADDFVATFQYKSEAEEFYERLKCRMGYFGLSLEEEKSRLIEFGRFARDNRVKPEFAAPGVQVSTAVGDRTGSSLAAALAAGCVAQFMEWAVVEGNSLLVETRTIESYFIRGAVREEGIQYLDKRWGYGKLNISGTFETLARL